MKLVIHLHLYYCEMWDKIKFYLKNIGDYPYLLCVTMVEENNRLMEEIKFFHANTKILLLSENRGYDVGPFIYFLKSIDLNDYDLILKIHTKNINFDRITKLDNCYVNNAEWFKLLMSNLLGSPKIFKNNIKIFEKHKKIGMLSAKYLLTKISKNYREKYIDDILINRLKCTKINKNLKFVAGTMFFVRTNLLERIKNNFDFNEFEVGGETGSNGSLAHILERLLGAVVKEEKYSIKGVNYTTFFKIKNFTNIVLKGRFENLYHQIKVILATLKP